MIWYNSVVKYICSPYNYKFGFHILKVFNCWTTVKYNTGITLQKCQERDQSQTCNILGGSIYAVKMGKTLTGHICLTRAFIITFCWIKNENCLWCFKISLNKTSLVHNTNSNHCGTFQSPHKAFYKSGFCIIWGLLLSKLLNTRVVLQVPTAIFAFSVLVSPAENTQTLRILWIIFGWKHFLYM